MRNKGWRNESERHALSSMGVKTSLREELNKSEMKSIKDKIRNVIGQSLKDGRERGFLIYEKNGNTRTTDIQEGGRKSVDMSWNDVMDDDAFEIRDDENLIGDFHIHNEISQPSYADVGGMLHLGYELDEKAPNIIMISSLSDVERDKAKLKIYTVHTNWFDYYQTDKHEIYRDVENTYQYYMDLLNIAKRYGTRDLEKAWYKCTEEDRKEFELLESELRAMVEDGTLFKDVDTMEVELT